MIDKAGEKNWDLNAKEFDALQEGTGEEKLAGRVGGAVTLAVGMSKVFAHAWMRVQGAGDAMAGGLDKAFREMPGMKTMMAYWYHFVTMFEALFILTLLETGTRVARFVFQEVLAQFKPQYTIGNKPRWSVNVTVSVVVCGLVGRVAVYRQFGHAVEDAGHRQSTAGDHRLGRGDDLFAASCPEADLRPLHVLPVRFHAGDDLHRGRSQHPDVVADGRARSDQAVFIDPRLRFGRHLARADDGHHVRIGAAVDRHPQRRRSDVGDEAAEERSRRDSVITDLSIRLSHTIRYECQLASRVFTGA